MTNIDFLIIGAGSAGLTAAMYAARSRISTIVIDSSGSGGQALQIADLENYPGIFPAISGYEIADKMQKQAESFGAKVISTQVSSIKKEEDSFTVETAKETYRARAILIATGAEHRALGAPGEKELTGRGVSYCAVCDGPFFRNKKIVVVGGGDSACTEALYLAELGEKVTLVHRRDTLRAQKVNIDRINANKKITVEYDSTVKEIKAGANGAVSSVVIKNVKSGVQKEIEASGVFILVGMTPRTDLVQDVLKDEAGYIKTDELMHTSVKGIFAAGDVRSKPLRQIITAASDGAVAAYAAEKYINSFNYDKK